MNYTPMACRTENSIMASMTSRDQGGRPEDTYLDDLMRAEAAASVDDDLEDEAPHYQRTHPAAETGVPAAHRAPSQVYSIRVPVDRLEQVRRLASERDVAPTVMLRQWVLARLDHEVGQGTPPDEPYASESPRRRTARSAAPRQDMSGQETATASLEAATAAVMEVAANLTRMMSVMAEIAIGRGPAVTQPASGLRLLPRSQQQPPQSAGAMPLAAAVPAGGMDWLTPAAAAWRPASPAGPVALTYLDRGLAQLRTTVENSAGWPGMGRRDLGNLYTVADEELSGP
jgi:hypothetical protein